MPNQYTKFKNASKDPQNRQFRWKTWKAESKQDRDTDTEERDTKALSLQNGAKARKRASYERNNQDLEQGTWLSQLHVPGHQFRRDPFTAYPIVPDQSDLFILDYYLYGLSPSGRGHRWFSPQGPRFDPHINMLLPFFMQHSVLYNATLANCQASILLSRGASATNDQKFLFHRTHAVSGLRTQLNDSADDAAILTAVMLLSAEYLVGNVRAVAAHTAGLNQMLKVRGELPTNTSWFKFMKGGIFAFKSIGYLMPVNVLQEFDLNPEDNNFADHSSPLIYPRHPFSTAMCHALSILPIGFSELMVGSKLSTQMVNIISAVATLQAEVVHSKSFPASISNPGSPLHPIQGTIQHYAQREDITQTEQIICAGLLAFTFQLMQPRKLNLFHDPPLQGFIHLLSRPWTGSTVVERHALIWTSMVVEGAMSLRPIRLPKSREIFISAISANPEMQQWQSLESILNQFFRTENLLDFWKDLWMEKTITSTFAGDFESHSSDPSISYDSAGTRASSSITDISSVETPPHHPSDMAFNWEATAQRCPFRSLV